MSRFPAVRAYCVIACALGLFGAQPARADVPTHIWAKVGATDESMEADQTRCAAEAKDVHANANTPLAIGPNPAASLIGGAIGAAIINGVREGRAQSDYLRSCMMHEGYVLIDLTPDEAADFGARTTSAARKQWIDQFLAGDLAKRIDAKRLTAPPAAKLEPLAIGGVRFSAADLVGATDEVHVGQTLLKGPVGHRRTARLDGDFELTDRAKYRAEAGAIFHQVVAPGLDGDGPQTYWCGPMSSSVMLIKFQFPAMCIWSDGDEYSLRLAIGQSWLAGIFLPQTVHVGGTVGDVSTIHRGKSGVVKFNESNEDLIGNIDFSLVLVSQDQSSVEVKAVADRDGKSVIFWKGVLKFDPSGVAVLPFWTHKLVLTRSGAAVRVAFKPEGDGSGWPVDGSEQLETITNLRDLAKSQQQTVH